MSWVHVLGSAGVIALFGRVCEGVFRWFVRRPLERAESAQQRAEEDRDYWRGQASRLAGELKATHEALQTVRRADEIAAGAPPDSLPPARAEMHTIDCIVEGPEARAWAAERARRVPEPQKRRGPPPPPVRVIETYSVNARPTLPAPPGTADEPRSLAPPILPPTRLPGAPPRPDRGRRGR